MPITGPPVEPQVLSARPAGFKPGDITPGPDGRLWFTESEAHKIGAVTTAGFVSEYDLPFGSDPSGIAASAGAMWFAEFGGRESDRSDLGGRHSDHPL